MIESIEEIDGRRKAAGLSWNRVCSVSGVHFSTVSAIRRDPGIAKVGTLEKLAGAVTLLVGTQTQAKGKVHG